MKSSQFNFIVKLNLEYYAIFNTLTEKYFLFKSQTYDDLKSVLISPFFSDTFSQTKSIFYDKCISDKFLVNNNKDELLAYSKKFKVYNDTSKLNVTLYYTTNSIRLTFVIDLINNICKFIDKSSNKYKHLQISWFYTVKYTNFEFLSILNTRFYSICKRHNCTYSSSLLIKDIFPKNIKMLINKLTVDIVEIDLSSCNSDKVKIIANKINEIFETNDNIIMKLTITLYDDIVINVNNLLKSINYQYRKNINVHFINKLNFEPNFFLYMMHKTHINLGYRFSYLDTVSSFVSSIHKNSFCIDSELNIASCIEAIQSKDYFARLDHDGSIKSLNIPINCLNLNESTVDDYKCAYCPELPICPSNYPYYKSTSKFLCIKDLYNDLTLEQKIKLKILSDTAVDRILPQLIPQ